MVATAGTRPVEDEVVLITGATAGLGQALASALATEGATVLVHGRDQVGGEAVVAALRQATGNDRVAFYRGDLASLAAVRRLAERVSAEQERLLWPGKVVTEVTPAGPFWEAEPEHQDYLERYPNGYTCHFPRPNWVLPRRTAAAR